MRGWIKRADPWLYGPAPAQVAAAESEKRAALEMRASSLRHDPLACQTQGFTKPLGPIDRGEKDRPRTGATRERGTNLGLSDGRKFNGQFGDQVARGPSRTKRRVRNFNSGSEGRTQCQLE